MYLPLTAPASSSSCTRSRYATFSSMARTILSRSLRLTNLVRFVDQFSRKELTADEKIARIREAHPWEPLFEVTSSGSWSA